MHATISRTGVGERFTRGNRIVTIRLDLPELSVHEIEFDATSVVSEPTHRHVDTMYVLAGTAEYLSGGAVIPVGPDTLVAAPASTPHGLRNASPGIARVLVFHAPDGGFADVVRNT